MGEIMGAAFSENNDVDAKGFGEDTWAFLEKSVFAESGH